MSQLRHAALVTLLAAAGCYSDVPPQSTTPDPRFVSGPPGGGMDPGYGYNPANEPGAYDSADSADSDDSADAGDSGPGEAYAPGEPGAAPGPGAGPGDVAQLGDGSAPPSDPTASVTDPEIDAALDGHGEWVETDDYGQVWRPDATEVGVDFTPYESGGSWEYSDAGWAFACDYPWGWLPFHYGRWAWFHGYWGWVPGHRWGPAWVEWRHGGGVVGWRPLPPSGHGSGHRWHGGDVRVRDHRHPELHDAHWRFATVSDFARPHVRAHLFGNTAEGLRVTTAVAAPPLRGSPVRAADLMRNRFAAGGRLGQPGSPIRDHRGTQAFGARPPLQGHQVPLHTYQPPAQSYPSRPLHTYQPPVQGYPQGAYQPPPRTYRPPAATYQPPPGYRPPVRTYQPPVRSYPQGYPRPPTYRPPVYQPPPRASQPYGPPPRAWSPPSSPPSHASPAPSSGSHSGGSGGGGSHSSSSSSSSSHSSSSSSSGGGGHHR